MRSSRADRTNLLLVVSKIKHKAFSIYTSGVCSEKQRILANGRLLRSTLRKGQPHTKPEHFPGKHYADQINIVAITEMLTAPPPTFSLHTQATIWDRQVSQPLLQAIPRIPQLMQDSRPQLAPPGCPRAMKTGHKAHALLPSLSQATWYPTVAHTSPQRTQILNSQSDTHEDSDAAKQLPLTSAGEPGAEGYATPDSAVASPTRAQSHSAKQEEHRRSVMAVTVITRGSLAGQAKKLSQQDEVRYSEVPGRTQAYL